MQIIFYTVRRIDGDYALLMSDEGVENLVARALLPPETDEGMRLKWEMFCYEIVSNGM